MCCESKIDLELESPMLVPPTAAVVWEDEFCLGALQPPLLLSEYSCAKRDLSQNLQSLDTDPKGVRLPWE